MLTSFWSLMPFVSQGVKETGKMPLRGGVMASALDKALQSQGETTEAIQVGRTEVERGSVPRWDRLELVFLPCCFFAPWCFRPIKDNKDCSISWVRLRKR